MLRRWPTSRGRVSSGMRGVLRLDEVPKHIQQDNIKTGYRRSATCCSPVRHNELVNVWSHVLGSLWAVYRLVIDMGWWPTMGAGLPLEHRWLFITSLVTALFCFSSSAVCHHFGGHARQSPAVLKQYVAVDHAGISIGMIGPFLPGLAVGFWCRPELFHLYLGGILAVTLLGIVLQQDPRWWSPGWKHVRVVTFGAAAVFALLPMTHMLWLARSNAAEQELAVPFLLRALGSLSMLAVGAAFFVTQWPETQFPGIFDFLGASHQLWHICSMACILNCYYMSYRALQDRMVSVCAIR